MSTIDRRRILHEGALATEALALGSGTITSGAPTKPSPPVPFDLHAPPGTDMGRDFRPVLG